jgi:hypothetical protein
MTQTRLGSQEVRELQNGFSTLQIMVDSLRRSQDEITKRQDDQSKKQDDLPAGSVVD